jgi:hypothetical protein
MNYLNLNKKYLLTEELPDCISSNAELLLGLYIIAFNRPKMLLAYTH